MKPLVTVICLSYNHAPFIAEALNALKAQRYENIQVLIVDDGSTDDSAEVIKKAIEGTEFEFIRHDENRGYTRSFNEGLALAKGEFIVDYALDDVMLPDFLSRSLERFEGQTSHLGVVFSNADYINEQSELIGNHKDILLAKKMLQYIPEGDLFYAILRRYFICTPTMVIRKEVFDRMGGYDENLAYEDFDFWVRSTRYWDYGYIDEVLFRKRKLSNSMSSRRYQHQSNEQMESTFQVCRKAYHLCKRKDEIAALGERLNYEYRQCLRHRNSRLAQDYQTFMKEIGVRKSRASRWVELQQMF